MDNCDGKNSITVFDRIIPVGNFTVTVLSIPHHQVAVLSAVHHTQTAPSLNPILPYDYCICLFILHLIHTCEPVEVPVQLSTPLSHRLGEGVLNCCLVAPNRDLQLITLGLEFSSYWDFNLAIATSERRKKSKKQRPKKSLNKNIKKLNDKYLLRMKVDSARCQDDKQTTVLDLHTFYGQYTKYYKAPDKPQIP